MEFNVKKVRNIHLECWSIIFDAQKIIIAINGAIPIENDDNVDYNEIIGSNESDVFNIHPGNQHKLTGGAASSVSMRIRNRFFRWNNDINNHDNTNRFRIWLVDSIDFSIEFVSSMMAIMQCIHHRRLLDMGSTMFICSKFIGTFVAVDRK